MADPKKEPQFEALVRELNEKTGRAFWVKRHPYPNPRTSRKMIEFQICCGDEEPLFATKDYNRVSEVLQYTIDLFKAGVVK